jgi:hypothetical protein
VFFLSLRDNISKEKKREREEKNIKKELEEKVLFSIKINLT